LQIGNGREDASSDQIAFDLGEPQLDLVEPGRVRGREVQMNVRMAGEEGSNALRLVRGEIVSNDVNFLAPRLVDHKVGQERDELGRGVPLGRLAQTMPASRLTASS